MNSMQCRGLQEYCALTAEPLSYEAVLKVTIFCMTVIGGVFCL